MVTLLLTSLLTAHYLNGQSSLDGKDVFKSVDPAVIRIESRDETGKVFGTGSGFIVTADGKFLTNYHVIQHARSLTVRLANEDAYDAVEVIDVDKRKDIAFLKMKAVDLPTVKLGRSSEVKVGDSVFVVGTPLGLYKNTLSNGIISGIRAADGFRLFQLTAAISPGNSGGPVLNTRGEVIAIASLQDTDAQNVNFAVPIDYARGLLTSTTTHPLSSVYEPPPPPQQIAEPKVEKQPSQTSAMPTLQAKGDEMRKTGLLPFFATKLYTWTDQDAGDYLGKPLRHRYSYDNYKNVDGDIFAYTDLSGTTREVELTFDSKTRKLKQAIIYPTGFNTEQAKKMLGDKYKNVKSANGTFFYMYQDKRVNVLFAKDGTAISIGLY